MGVATVLLLVLRPPVTLFSWFMIGPAFGVNVGMLVPAAYGRSAVIWVCFFDFAAYLALLIAGLAVTITGRVRTVAAIYAVVNGWYLLTLLAASIIFSVDAEDFRVVLLVLAFNGLAFWLPLRACRKARAAGEEALESQFFRL